MTKPCSSIFNNAQRMKLHKNDKVAQPAENQLCLNLIKQKILENKYQRIQNWFDDIEQLWTEIEIQPSIEPEILCCVSESRKLFNKERRSIDILSTSSWPDELARVKTKLLVAMSFPPPKIKQVACTLNNSLIPKPEVPAIDEKELRAFVKASDMMETEEENNEINRILLEMQPEINIPENSSALVDVTALSVQTIQALKAYMKSRLEERGLQYPTS